MNHIRERLAEGGVFSEAQARRLATVLAEVNLETLRAEPQCPCDGKLDRALRSFRNRMIAAQAVTALAIILYIELLLWASSF